MAAFGLALRQAIAANSVYGVLLDKPLSSPITTASVLAARSIVDPVLLDITMSSNPIFGPNMFGCFGTATFAFPIAGTEDLQIYGMAIYLDAGLTQMIVATAITNGPFALTFPDGTLTCPFAIGVYDRVPG